MNNQHEFQQHYFDSIEFQLEIFSPGAPRRAPRYVCKGTGEAIGYSPLHLCNLENPALLKDFKSLKTITNLPADKIILELALSSRADNNDFSSFHEQPIGKYLIGDGETIELPEVTQYGFAPMVARATRLKAEEIPLDQFSFVNYTAGLQLISVKKKAHLLLLTLRNISDKTICRYLSGIESVTSGGAHGSHHQIAAGAEIIEMTHLPLRIASDSSGDFQMMPPEQYTFVLGALMYDDKSCEGKLNWLYQMFFSPLHQEQLLPFLPPHLRNLVTLPFTRQTGDAPRLPHHLTDVKTILSGLTIQGKHWSEEEIAQRMFLGWLRTNAEKSVRMIEWGMTNRPAEISEEKLALAKENLARQKQLLREIPSEE